MLATLGGYYTSAETNSVVTTALAPYSTTAQVDAAIAAALLPYSTTSETDAATAAAIAAALLPYSTTSETDAAAAAAIAAALLPYSTTSEMDAAITAALLQYYTATGVDNAIAAALVPYYTAAEVDSAISTAGSGITSVSNAPAWGANPPTWELLTGSLLRNLHFAGPLSGSLQNAGNTLQIDCDSYEKAETFTQAETNAAIAAAIDALNLNLYYTSAQTDTAITDALAPYYTSAQTDAAISSATGGFLTQAQGDSRYFLTTANFVGTRLVREDVTPPTLRTLLPRAPLSNNLISSNGTVELLCDCYSKSESDARYFPTSGNTSGGSIFEMILTGFTPRIIRAILPRPPLSGAAILGNGATLELNCDCWSKSEADGRYYTQAAADAAFAPMTTETGLQNLNLQVIDIDGRLATLEASGGVPDPTITSAVHAPGGSVNLDLRAGTSSVRFFASDGTTQLANFSSNECFFDQPVRVDDQLTIDDVSRPAVGLLTNTVSARVGDSLLTLTGGTAGVRAQGALEITGATAGTEADFPTHVATARLQPSPSTNAYMQLLTGITGLEVADQGLSPLLRVEDDETKSYSRLISVTRAAVGGTVGAVLKNTAGTGFARLQLDANASGGFAQLEVASAGGCTLYAPNQEIWLQNRTSGAAPLVIETDSDVTVNYGFNNLSDSKVKENIRDADLGELQAIFDAAAPKRYDRTDVAHRDRLGFLAQDFEQAGVTGRTYIGDQELMTLDYSRLTAVLWGVCKRLQSRIEALEKKPKGNRAK